VVVKLAYREQGAGAVPVLLLHGLFGAGDNLGALARQIAVQRRVLMVDLRNHGQSPHAPTMTLAEMADDVRVLLDDLAIERVDLVGHSLGGKVAMQFALQHPARVRRLVVVDIAPVAYPRGHDAVFAALHAVDLATVQNRRDAEAMMAPVIAEPMLRQFLLKSLDRRDSGFAWRFNLPALEVNYEDLRAAPWGQSFRGPTLFVRGELSDYIAPMHESALFALFPGARIETIAGAGHWVHGENPALFNRLVEAFLASD
jgi:esterase